MADQNEFAAQVRLEFTDLEEMQGRLREAVTGAMDGGLKMTKSMMEKFAIMKTRAGELKQIMAQAESEADFKEARQAMAVLNKDASRLANQLLRTKGVPALDAARIRQAKNEMNQLARAQEFMAQSTIKTSLASQNVVRIIQDAPFGMFGIANNIEQMAESMGRLIKQTGSIGAALKATFMPLVVGPMALPFIISLMTAFTLGWDKLAAGIDKAKVALGFMTEAQAEFNKLMRDIEKNTVKDAIDKIPWDELGLQIEKTSDILEKRQQTMREKQQAFADEFGFTFQEALDAEKKLADAQAASRGAGGGGFIAGGGELKKMAAAADEGRESMSALADEIERIEGGLERMQARDLAEFRKQQILGSVGLPMFEDLDDDTGSKKKPKDVEAKRQQLIIDAMKDGLEKRIAQIRLNGEIERKEIEREFNNNAELIQLSLNKENQLVIQERAEFVRDMEKIAIDAKLDAADKGFEREVAKIKSDAEARRKVVKTEFGGDIELMKLIDSAEEQALENARERRAAKLKQANDKLLAQQARDRQKALQEAKKRVQEETKILVFGVQEQAMKVRAAIDQSDPFQAQIDEANTRQNERLSLIRVRRMEIQRLVDEGLMSQKLANAELAKLGMEEVLIREDTANAVKKIEEQKAATIMGVNQQIFGNMGQLFGNLNTLSAKEGEKGLEETKKFLFAQAVAEAIAAGISAYQGWMSMKGVPVPIRIAAAASSMAMITTRLMAAARRIKQIGKNSAGTSQISGGFTQLNNAVTGQRVTAFEQQQRSDRTRTDNGDVAGALNDFGQQLNAIASRPVQVAGVRVVYDDRTAGDILTKGTEFNQRHTSKISGATVGE